MKIIMNIARYIFIICLPFLLLTVVIAGAVNCNWVYTHGFEKYNIRQSLADTGLELTKADMADIARGFIRYWNSSEEFINLNVRQQGKTVALFNTEEIIHFKDVKGLFRLDYAVLLDTFLYCLAFGLVSIFWNKGGNRKTLVKATLWGSGITLGLVLLLGIGTLTDFNNLFYQFHLLVFTNQFWSAEGNMLLLFPDGFWYDAATYCVLAIAGLAVVLGGLSWIYLGGEKRKSRLLQT